MKKTAGILLTLCILLSLVPLPVSAVSLNLALPFNDVPGDSWYAESVRYVYDENLMNGTNDSLFEPGGALTRAMFVTILGRLDGGVDVSGASATGFADVGANTWYAPYVRWASEKEIIQGYGNGLFGTDDPVTREQMSAMIARYLTSVNIGLPDVDDAVERFSDAASVSSWAAEGIELARRSGLLRGDDRGNFNPGSFSTRAEAATLFMRLSIAVETSGSAFAPPSAYSITGLSVDKQSGRITADVSTIDSCKLVVQIYAEARTSLLATGSIEVSGGLEMQAVSVFVPQSALPEYFVAVASLVDGDGREACSKYTCITYTQAYEEFEAKTIHDFGDSIVLSFDDSESDNFAVMSEGSSAVYCGTDGVNLLDYYREDSGTYRFTNIDETISGLNPGDTLAVFDGAETRLVLVKDISIAGTSAVITSVDDYAMEDFFQYVKIDMDSPVSGADIDMSNADPGITLMDSGAILMEDEFSAPLKLEINCGTENLHLTGQLAAVIKAHIEIDYDAKWLSENYFSFKFTTSMECEAGAKIELKAGTDDVFSSELKIGEIDIPFGIIGLAASAELSLPLDLEVSGGGAYTKRIKTENGFTYNTYDGYQEINRKSFDATASLEGEAKITLGPKLSVGLEYFEDLLKAGVSLHAGFEIAGALKHEFEANPEPESKHACTLCVDGRMDIFAKAAFKLEYKISKLLRGTPVDVTLAELRFKWKDFYVSILNDDESIHEGKLTFGWGDCTNVVWRIAFEPKKQNGEVVSEAAVTVKDSENNIVSTGIGRYVDYMYDGLYTASASAEGLAPASESFAVIKKAQTVTIKMSDDWRSAYAALLRSPPDKSNGFYLYDMDDDGTPELIIKYFRYGDCANVYTYSGGSVKLLGDTSEIYNGNFFGIPADESVKGFYFSWGGNGRYALFGEDHGFISDGKLVFEALAGAGWKTSSTPQEGYTYDEFDGVYRARAYFLGSFDSPGPEITYDEYRKVTACTPIEFYDINESNIKSVIFA